MILKIKDIEKIEMDLLKVKFILKNLLVCLSIIFNYVKNIY
jgi:hypothetical protein